jgi:hypothetical protein
VSIQSKSSIRLCAARFHGGIRDLTNISTCSLRLCDGRFVGPLVPCSRAVVFYYRPSVYGFLDTPLIIEELNNLMGGPRLRPMAHDIHFEHFNDVSGGRWGSFCTALGAIRATPRNFYRLLRQGEPILLFPGGPTEVCRRRGQKNLLLWSEETDFVRPAARMNAVIVPFSCVGADDAIDIILDGQELQRVPLLGPVLRQALLDNDLDPEQ